MGSKVQCSRFTAAALRVIGSILRPGKQRQGTDRENTCRPASKVNPEPLNPEPVKPYPFLCVLAPLREVLFLFRILPIPYKQRTEFPFGPQRFHK